MRLIDADKLIEDLKGSMFYTDAIPFVEDMPTAYNVDAVVEQIEALEDVGRSWTHKHILSNKAIEIVRKGGVNE